MRKNVMTWGCALTLLLGVYTRTSCRAGETKATASPGGAPDPRQAVLLEDVVKVANQAAQKRCDQQVAAWTRRIQGLGSTSGFQDWANVIVSWEEKFAQGADWIGTGSSAHADRLVAEFRQTVLNDSQLVQEMETAFRRLEADLINESIQLYVRVGVEAKLAMGAWKPCQLNPAVWQQQFLPLFRRAETMCHEDWFRAGINFVASDLGARAVQHVARESGVHEGGWMDLLIGLGSQFALEVAAESVTDPTRRLAQELTTEFEAVKRRLLTSPAGLIPTFREITRIHQQGRLIHLGLKKPVKK